MHRQEALAALDARKRVDLQIGACRDELQRLGADETGSLVDSDGFPLSDVDIVAVRTVRNRLIMLKNDRRELDRQIAALVQDALPRRAQDSASPGAPLPSESASESEPASAPGSVSASASAPAAAAANTTPKPLYVRSVAPDSPAAAAGLRAGDELRAFGAISSVSAASLSEIPAQVRPNIPIAVHVARHTVNGYQVIPLTLTPQECIYAVLGSHGRHAEFESYITPAQWLFAVWPVIHALFLGMLVYQFTRKGTDIVKSGLGWNLPLMLFLNSLCDALFTAHGSAYHIAGFIVLSAVAALVSHLYGHLRMTFEPDDWCDSLFVFLPLSLYHGLVVVVYFVAAFAVFGVDARTHAPGLVTKVLVFLTLFFLESTATGYVFYGNGDLAGASVITLGLVSIAAHQHNRFIHWSAIGFALIALIAVVRAFFSIVHNPEPLHDEESAPLTA
ncbi:hypothetical protein MCUN1_002873 [Malassezia cuniculi]|uniref:Nas2 N-terminal domain-containing protein n=1 Tax=Malassezia cuniculi TaxID=948313 RepID=A0AAF0EWF9_9BASI|nr:hypothetical protein MCUN1_002873 [Malassezia cuniculi]